MFARQTRLGIRRDFVLLTRACCFSGPSLERDCACALIYLIDEGVRAACFQESIHHTLPTQHDVVDGDGVEELSRRRKEVLLLERVNPRQI